MADQVLGQKQRKLSKPGRIEAWIHILLISSTACIVIYTFTVHSSPSSSDVDVLEIGDSLPRISSYMPSNRTGLILLALSPGCRYCRQSYPFYETLIAMRDQKRSSLPIIAAVDTSSSIKLQTLLLEDAGVHTDSLIALPFHSSKIHFVPMIIYLDSHGKIREIWEGMLSEEGESDALSVIFHGI